MSTRSVPAPKTGHCFSGGCRRKASHSAMIQVIETGRPAARAEVCAACLKSYQAGPKYYEVTDVRPLPGPCKFCAEALTFGVAEEAGQFRTVSGGRYFCKISADALHHPRKSA